MPLFYRASPIQEFNHVFIKDAGVTLLIKREDMNHPEIQGNKWWKLKYNLARAREMKCETLLTFGGAYSNHIFATAGAARENGFRSIGVIRGEEVRPLNPTLSYAEGKGMKLHFVSRADYRQKTDIAFIESLRNEFGDFYLIPEGGTNALAVKGCSEFAVNLAEEISFDYVCVPVGTGGTMAGMISGLKGKSQVIGYSSLKGGAFLEEAVRLLLMPERFTNWEVRTGYDFGGYGKRTVELMNFIAEQRQQNQLPLDVVYTSKMIFGILNDIKEGKFPRGSVIVAVHTGGLQSASSEESFEDFR